MTRKELVEEISHLEGEVQKERREASKQERERFEKKLTEAREELSKILQNLVSTRYRGSGKEYQLAIRFSPDIFSWGPTRDQMEHLAEIVAHRVRLEIVSSKFIRDARDFEVQNQPIYKDYGVTPDDAVY